MAVNARNWQQVFDMSDELLCPACGDLLSDPRLLECLHTVCLGCATAAIKRGATTVTCPVCKFGTACRGNPASLQANAPLADIVGRVRASQAPCDECNTAVCTLHCPQCDSSYCEACNQRVHSFRTNSSHSVVAILSKQAQRASSKCPSHPSETLSMYCRTDRVPVCGHCLLMGPHRGHPGVSLEESFPVAQREVAERLANLASSSAELGALVSQRDQMLQLLDANAQECRDTVASHFAELRALLDAKEAELLGGVEQQREQRGEQLAASREQLGAAAKQADDLSRTVNGLTKRCNAAEFMSMHHQIAARLATVDEAVGAELRDAKQNPSFLSARLQARFHGRLAKAIQGYSFAAAEGNNGGGGGGGGNGGAGGPNSSSNEDDPSTPMALARAGMKPLGEFVYRFDGDSHGLVHWMGSEGGVAPFSNPALSGCLAVSCSSILDGRSTAVVDRGHERGAFVQTQAEPAAWVCVDLGEGYALCPTTYTLAYFVHGTEHIPANWDLQGSSDGAHWTLLSEHIDEDALREPPHIASWAIHRSARTRAFRFFRVVQTGPTSSNSLYLVLSGLELYGSLHSV